MKSIVMFKEVVDCLNSRFSSHEFIRKFLEKNHKEYAARLKKQDSVALANAEIANYLRNNASELGIKKVGDIESMNILGHLSICALWEKLGE